MDGNEVADFIRHYQLNDGVIKDERYRCTGDKENLLKSEWEPVANALDQLIKKAIEKVVSEGKSTGDGVSIHAV